MSNANRIILNANRKRFAEQKVKVAAKLREMADEIDRIDLVDHKGEERQPVAVIGQMTSTILFGVANLKLDSMALWAEGIYETLNYEKEV